MWTRMRIHDVVIFKNQNNCQFNELQVHIQQMFQNEHGIKL